MAVIRSSGWLTDMIIAAPDSLLLSYAWLLLVSGIPALSDFLITGGILIIFFAALLFGVGAWLAGRQKADHVSDGDFVKMSALGLDEAVIEQAKEAGVREELAWKAMVKDNTGGTTGGVSSPAITAVRTAAISLVAGLVPIIPLFFPTGAYTIPLLYGLTPALLFLVGWIKSSSTGRPPLKGGIRLCVTGISLCLLIRFLLYVLG